MSRATRRHRVALIAGAASSACAACAILAGCAAGPDYHRPDSALPADWRPEAPWRAAAPGDAQLKGDWWTVFADPVLDQLEQQATRQSPTLAAAAARLDQARATVQVTAAALLPQVGLSSGADRARISANRPLAAYNVANQSTIQNEFSLGLQVRYEADLSGRIRRQVEGARASAAQASADFENTRLLLHSEVASDYFSLRELDLETDIVERGIVLQQRALDLVSARHDLGDASGLDVAQQQALLDSTRTQRELLVEQRARFEHALAALVGAAAPVFQVAPAVSTLTPPPIPVGVPSDLLERRPDVASAERAMAAANAQIGVARAAYFPSIFLTPSGGWDSRMLSTLLDGPSLLWSIGASATQTVFDGGRIKANVRFASSGYEVAVGNYRQSVLTAMQEVQDGVSSLGIFGRALADAQTAIGSSEHSLSLATDRYSGGLSNYVDVINAEQTVLGNRRQAAQIAGQQMLAAVFLVKALGGGWQGLQ